MHDASPRRRSRTKYNQHDPSFGAQLGETSAVHCRFRDCPKTPEANHGLCRAHRAHISDAFQQFYVAAQNLVEDLALADIKVLPEATVDSPFIRLCDRFLNVAVPFWFDNQEVRPKTETRRPLSSSPTSQT